MARFFRTLAIVAVIVLLALAIFFSSSKETDLSEKVWDEQSTTGNLEAKNYYVMYSDIMCPYCDVFSRLVIENQKDFDDYLAENDILFELRITDMLYESSGQEFSRTSAEGVYCAKREGKFWDYYRDAVMSLWEDYHSKGIGDSKTSPRITDMTDDYWYKIGHEVGLGDSFDNCMKNHETVEEITNNTKAASRVVSGLPYFQFNDFTSGGFDSTWDWGYVVQYLNAGIGKEY